MTDAHKAQIDRINEISAMARTSWLALLGYLAFIGISLLAVEDADFFVPTRRTDLPLVGVAIPTFSFFLFAPILAAALYIYLHIHLLKLWDAIADAPDDHRRPAPRRAPPPLDRQRLRPDPQGRRRPPPAAPCAGSATSPPSSWSGSPAPAVIAGFWWRSMPAHDEGLTLAIAVALLLALHAGLTSWWTAHARLRSPGRAPPLGRWWRRPAGIAPRCRRPVSWLRTEGGLDTTPTGSST